MTAVGSVPPTATLLASGVENMGVTKADCDKFPCITLEASRGKLVSCFKSFQAVWAGRDRKLMLAKQGTSPRNPAFKPNVPRNPEARREYDAYMEQKKSKSTGSPFHSLEGRRAYRLRQQEEMDLWWRHRGSRRLHCPFMHDSCLSEAPRSRGMPSRLHPLLVCCCRSVQSPRRVHRAVPVWLWRLEQ